MFKRMGFDVIWQSQKKNLDQSNGISQLEACLRSSHGEKRFLFGYTRALFSLFKLSLCMLILSSCGRGTSSGPGVSGGFGDSGAIFGGTGGHDSGVPQARFGGGQDGGGGSVERSSIEQVRAAVSRSLELVYEPHSQVHIYYNFIAWNMYRLVDKSLAEGEVLLSNIEAGSSASKSEPESSDSVVSRGRSRVSDSELYRVALAKKEKKAASDLLDNAMTVVTGERSTCFVDRKSCSKKVAGSTRPVIDQMGEHFLRMIRMSKIDRRESGPCESNGNDHVDASVSAFRPGADLCLSLSSLQRVPPSSLQKEILALLFHEAAHLSGFGEEDARRLQAAFGEYYDYRFGAASRHSLLSRTGAAVKDCDRLIESAQALAQRSPQDSRVQGYMGRLSELLIGLPSWNDTLVLNIAMGVELSEPDDNRKRAVNAYSNSVFSLIRDVRKGFGLASCKNKSCAPLVLGDRDVLDRLEKIAQGLNVVRQNWRVLERDEGDFVCVDYPPLDGFIDEESFYRESPYFGELGSYRPSCR